ncbi:peptide chain release factor N(5)-glutamine methyltransferase [Calidithermus roseus]|uniref:Release factor glutamine methyltransferase n=1 Tax=Calidithermus roseus TaxID=1644118 RepID=A0A399EYB3_9DEIN|nr:peptide chain release factor N(5)-glutamine methyltransferase [Calidithermus roseus]RIH89564.1 Release factor glutamine methyltransferase [Calidithermus roseus]
MTVRALLNELGNRLESAHKPSQEAYWLLAKALRTSSQRLLLRLGEEVTPEAEARARSWLERRLEGYPLQLLLGDVEFFGLSLEVREGVLIPRPETEELVEIGLGLLTPRQRPRVLDVGTGTGAIALAIKHARPDAEVWATDIDPAAVELARENAARLDLEVRVLEAPFTAGLAGFGLVISNPPYLPEAYRQEAPPELAFERDAALYSGPDGLSMPRGLLSQAQKALKPGGWLALELSPDNAPTLAEEAVSQGWQGVQLRADLRGRYRFLVAQSPMRSSP